jgi:hypothetical protein
LGNHALEIGLVVSIPGCAKEARAAAGVPATPVPMPTAPVAAPAALSMLRRPI